MTSLVRSLPLADAAPLVGEGFTATPARGCTLTLMQGDPARLAAAIPGGLPQQPNRAIICGDQRVLWMSPGSWWIVGAGERLPQESPFVAAAAGEVCRLTDLSHAQAAIELRGDAVRAVLGRGTPLDLRPGRFSAGCCARTVCAGFTVVLDHLDASLMLYVEAPLARALWNWLQDAAIPRRR